MKRTVSILLCILLLSVLSAASSEPVHLSDDLTGKVTLPFFPDEPSSAGYCFSYCYPHIDEQDPSAEAINNYYDYQISNALDFEIPMLADYYASENIDTNRNITYRLTCNNGYWFSVLICTEEAGHTSYAGNTFAREDTKSDSTVSLPYLLGILDKNEDDTWLQERQTEKADRLIREIVWDSVCLNPENIEYYPYVNETYLADTFYPEDDFFLDETGTPVFYLQPGDAAPEEYGLITFPIPLDVIRDEM